ncbi:hypothetical protein ACVWWR_002483 [Bradyrhizobium sp. LM3.2]
MVLGLSLPAFTMVHVIISLIGIAAGLVVMFGLLGSKPMPGLTAIFLLFTILTSATGFLFPFKELLPSHIIGIISLVLLAIACIALYGMKLAGVWRPVYIVTAMISLYFNVFVLVIQSFLKGAGACRARARSGAGAAGRPGVRRGAGHRAGVLRGAHRRCLAPLQADGVRLIVQGA